MPASPIVVEPLCRPHSASQFCLETHVAVSGFHVDIRRFSWNQPQEKAFEANSYYIDYSLGPRAQEAHFIHPHPPGETVFLPKGARFQAYCAPSSHRLLCLTFDNNRAAALFEADELTRDLPPCLDVRAPFARPALQRLAVEIQNPGFACDIMLESTALMLVVELCRHFQTGQRAQARQGGMAEWRLNRLKDLILNDLGSPLSLNTLATACGVSPRHLARTFKVNMGVTLTTYIADIRIKQAKRLLTQNDHAIKAVAHQFGFQSASAFAAAFRKSTGITPKRFRERCLHEQYLDSSWCQ